MVEKRNAFQRAFDAVVESRTRRAEYEVATYRRMFDLEVPRKAR